MICGADHQYLIVSVTLADVGLLLEVVKYMRMRIASIIDYEVIGGTKRAPIGHIDPYRKLL
jgi:hypothetical protein